MLTKWLQEDDAFKGLHYLGQHKPGVVKKMSCNDNKFIPFLSHNSHGSIALRFLIYLT
jgi:hypothetical protein